RHADRAQRHQEDGCEQRLLAPARIAEPPDHHGAERAGEEPDAECREAREQRCRLAAAREEVPPDDAGNEGVDRKIIPFEEIADDGGEHDAAQLHRRRDQRGVPISRFLHAASPALMPGACGRFAPGAIRARREADARGALRGRRSRSSLDPFAYSGTPRWPMSWTLPPCATWRNGCSRIAPGRRSP